MAETVTVVLPTRAAERCCIFLIKPSEAASFIRNVAPSPGNTDPLGNSDKASWEAGRGRVGCALRGPRAPEARTGGSLGLSRGQGQGWSRENILEGL